MRVLLFLRYSYIRRRYVNTLVPVPVFLVDGVWVMRMGEGNCETEWAGGQWATSGSVQVASRFEHYLLVKLELVGAYAGASLEDGGRVVVPFETTIGFVPVDGPKNDERYF